RLDASLRPAVPAVDVQVGPANRSRLHAYQHIGKANRRDRDCVHLQPSRRPHLPPRFHRRCHRSPYSGRFRASTPPRKPAMLTPHHYPRHQPHIIPNGASRRPSVRLLLQTVGRCREESLFGLRTPHFTASTTPIFSSAFKYSTTNCNGTGPYSADTASRI